jgi:large subunit ribosomal protein L24
MNPSIKVNDTVEVIAGREKGKKGRVLKVFPRSERLVVEKVNFVKRHTRPSQKSRQGGIVEKEGPIHISNVMVFCKKCNRPVRVRRLVGADNVKSRACARCGELF